MSEAYAVDVEGVQKRFGEIKALDGVTLRVRRGEIYGLLGPNGAGKTTLIRAIVGLIAPDAGTVTVNTPFSRRVAEAATSRPLGRGTLLLNSPAGRSARRKRLPAGSGAAARR